MLCVNFYAKILIAGSNIYKKLSRDIGRKDSTNKINSKINPLNNHQLFLSILRIIKILI